MPTASAIYRAAVNAARSEHDRAMAQLIDSDLAFDELASARCDVHRMFIGASAAALAAYVKARKG
jgi:hypothetical protein